MALRYLILLLVSFLLVSCSSDNNKNSDKNIIYKSGGYVYNIQDNFYPSGVTNTGTANISTSKITYSGSLTIEDILEKNKNKNIKRTDIYKDVITSFSSINNRLDFLSKNASLYTQEIDAIVLLVLDSGVLEDKNKDNIEFKRFLKLTNDLHIKNNKLTNIFDKYKVPLCEKEQQITTSTGYTYSKCPN
ncbi:MAG: hypothetical protein PHO80_02410 [Candidatus Gracilibacteria bacterium]|nr:hypothetical protein [Candidatus Gracilibacteria bacterium]